MGTEETQVLRGFLANIDVIPPLVLTFQFNPTSVRDNKVATYSDDKATLSGGAPGKIYAGGGHRTIIFDLKLHGLEQGSNVLNPSAIDNGVSTELAKLRSFLYPRADAWSTLGGGGGSGARLVSPPKCVFGFGTKVLACVVTDVKVNETQFNSALAPVRAEVTVTLDVVEGDGDALYQLDTQRRGLLAALGLQNIRVF